jgi:hypothetical protein
MILSQAVSNMLSPFSKETTKEQKEPLSFIRNIFKQIAAYASVRKISGGKSIGKTDPLFGEREQEAIKKASIKSMETQFPSKVKLPDGRHRYYKKHGVLVDRLA